MGFIKLGYNDYVKIRELMLDLKEQGDLDPGEIDVLMKIDGIIKLMVEKQHEIAPVPRKSPKRSSARSVNRVGIRILSPPIHTSPY